MVRLIYVSCIVLINTAICGQSHKTKIPINPISDSFVEMESSFVTLNFGDFFLYYTPNQPFELSVHNITDSSQVLLSVVFSLEKSTNKEYIRIKSIEFEHMDKKLQLSRKDSLRIMKNTLTSLKEKKYFIKCYSDIKTEWNYFMYIPVILTPLSKN